jgi:hypothetical protein
MSSNEPSMPPRHGPRPWTIAARLALWYTEATFVLVAIATGLLYWVLVTNVGREDDQFLVDTAQIMRALIRERPTDIAALEQEVDWEGTARRYARVYVRVLDEQGRLIIETPGATSIIARHTLTPADATTEPGPGIDVTSPAGAPYRMLAAWAPLGTAGQGQRLIQIALDRTTQRQLLSEYRSRLWAVLGLALLAAGIVGYTIARRGMRPVAAIADTARRIGSSTLDARIPDDGLPGELSSLAATVRAIGASRTGVPSRGDRAPSPAGPNCGSSPRTRGTYLAPCVLACRGLRQAPGESAVSAGRYARHCRTRPAQRGGPDRQARHAQIAPHVLSCYAVLSVVNCMCLGSRVASRCTQCYLARRRAGRPCHRGLKARRRPLTAVPSSLLRR